MNNFSYFLIPLIILTDILAINHLIKRTHYSTISKLTLIAMILIFPIIGISIYYLLITLYLPKYSKRKET
jgi:hypothetical protein